MSLLNLDGVIWMDGQFIPWQDAKIHVLSHTLHYGCGVFEGVRAYKTDQGAAIFKLQQHTDRLFQSAHILGMTIPFSKQTLNDAQIAVIEKNQLNAAYIRPMVFYGAEALGLQTQKLSTHVIIAAWPWGAYLGEAGLQHGIKVCTSSYTRHHVNSTMCKAKANGNYINSILALQEALAHGCEEALLLDAQGLVAEGSGENIFIVRNGKLFTPDTTAILEGITRDTIFTLATDLGLTLTEKRITRDEVYIADEAFFTGTAAEVTPIREIDGRAIGDGKPGIITKRLQKLYFDVVQGKNPQYQQWLTPI